MKNARSTPTRKLARLAAATSAAAIALTLASCSGTVPIEAGPDSNNPLCAEVTIRLPDTVAGKSKRETNSQATGAWGDPVAVELVCGENPVGPTTMKCVNVDGIDWVIDDSKAPLYRFVAYGREPGLSVYVHSERASGTEAVVDLGQAVSQLPQKRECTSVADTLDSKDGSAG